MIYLGGAKQTELMALLVDRAQAGLSSGEAISCLWPDGRQMRVRRFYIV
ncbi:MAG: hypothetical protein ACOCNC_05865 [Acetivibrio ethanolgignens]